MRQSPPRPKEWSFTPAVQRVVRRRAYGPPPLRFERAPDSGGRRSPGLSPWASEGSEGTTFLYGSASRLRASITHRRIIRWSALTIEELAEFPWFDFTGLAPQTLEQQVESCTRRSGVRGGARAYLETAWQMTRMEKLMGTYPAAGTGGLRLRSDHHDRAFRLPGFAEAGCDMIHCGDDVGMQDRLMMSRRCGEWPAAQPGHHALAT